MKNSFVAVSVQEDGKYYAYMVKISESDNALSRLAIKGIVHANIFTTKKKAEEAVDCWNECYRINGTYMFSPFYD